MASRRGNPYPQIILGNDGTGGSNEGERVLVWWKIHETERSSLFGGGKIIL